MGSDEPVCVLRNKTNEYLILHDVSIFIQWERKKDEMEKEETDRRLFDTKLRGEEPICGVEE